MTTPETELSRKMRQIATTRSDLPENWMELADKLDTATERLGESPPTITIQQFLGHYARARRAGCDATGEPLV